MEKELIEALDDLVSELNRTNYDREELDELASWHERAEEILQKAKEKNKQKFLNLVDGKDETFFSDLRDIKRGFDVRVDNPIRNQSEDQEKRFFDPK